MDAFPKIVMKFSIVTFKIIKGVIKSLLHVAIVIAVSIIVASCGSLILALLFVRYGVTCDESTCFTTHTIGNFVAATTSALLITFFLEEPLYKAVGLYESGTCPELEQYCTDCLLKELSFKAVDEAGNIVGLLLNNIYPLKSETSEYIMSKATICENEKLQKLLYMLVKREEGTKLWKMYPEEGYKMDAMIAATDPGWRRRGIMEALLRETEKIAQQKGVRLLCMDTTSAYSAKAAERLGFTCVYKALYADIKKEGQPIIIPEAPHVDTGVYVKILFDRQ